MWGKIDCAALCPSRVSTSDWASCLCIRKHLVTLLNPLICPVHQSNREPSVASVREQHNADDIRMMSCQGGDRQTCRQQQLKVKRIQPIAHWREREREWKQRTTLPAILPNDCGPQTHIPGKISLVSRQGSIINDTHLKPYYRPSSWARLMAQRFSQAEICQVMNKWHA